MSFTELPVGSFLERVAARQPAPAGGTVAAATLAAAAALVAMAGRFTDEEAHAGLIERADALRDRACALGDADAAAYKAVLEARSAGKDDPDRRARIADALGHASDVPLALADAAREVAELGARLVADGNPNLRGDAITAVLLADAAGRSAARLVEINVRLGRLDDKRLHRSAAACAALAATVRAVEEVR